MRVVGIQEDGKIEFLTQTPHSNRKLPRSRKLPFSLRSANHNRHFQLTRSFEDTFQQDEIGDVEVPNGDTVSSCFLHYFNEFLHGCFPRTIICKPAAIILPASSDPVPSGGRCISCRSSDAASRNTDPCVRRARNSTLRSL